jgi:thiaminase (transcriptional activator TenA)
MPSRRDSTLLLRWRHMAEFQSRTGYRRLGLFRPRCKLMYYPYLHYTPYACQISSTLAGVVECERRSRQSGAHGPLCPRPGTRCTAKVSIMLGFPRSHRRNTPAFHLPLCARCLSTPSPRNSHHLFPAQRKPSRTRRSAFQAYIVEDAFFLASFAYGYEAAIARCHPGVGIPATICPAAAAAAKQRLEDLHRGVQEELSLHGGFAASWGVDLSQHTSPTPATQRYVDFLKQVVDRESPQESVASILSSMIPCLRLYAYLGCTLSNAFPCAEHEYAEWITTYCTPAYVLLPAIAEALVDELRMPTDSIGEIFLS